MSDENADDDLGSHAVVVVDHSARLGEIEQTMKTDMKAYYASGMGDEMLQLLREQNGDLTATDPMPAGDSRAAMIATPEGQSLVSEWNALGGFERVLGQVQSNVGNLVQGFGDDRAQRAFMARFDRTFPEPVRYEIYRHIALGPPTFVRPADDRQVTAFAAGDPGRELVAGWGSLAGEMIGRVWDRVERLKNSIGAEEMEIFKEWFNGLGADRQGRVLKFIAEGK